MVKDDLSWYPREAEGQEIVITRHGKLASVQIGFETEDDWLEYRLTIAGPDRSGDGSLEDVRQPLRGPRFKWSVADAGIFLTP